MQASQTTIQMNIVKKGAEKPITSEMIVAVLKKLAQGNPQALPLSA